MATVAVTGGRGHVGCWVVDRLADAGHTVICIDRNRPGSGHGDVEFYAADIAQQGEAWELIQSADPDAVVHLAAIPAMGITTGTTTFSTNVLSTYHTLVAAGECDAEVVWTSSGSAYGMPYAEEPWLPDYLPLDEEHELRPEDPYGTSKVAGEEIAKMVARRYDVAVTSIRPMVVTQPGQPNVREEREAFDLETAEPRGALWASIDVRDLATMIEAALEADHGGHEALLAAADENYLGLPTADVIEAAFGRLPEEHDLDGDESAASNAKAKALLDWRPEHPWRDAEDDDVAPPSFANWQ